MTDETFALTLRGLTKSYGDFRLGPLDLDLELGRVVAFVGPNGAGKTTTLQSIMRLVRPDGGEVKIHGRVNDPQDVRWKEEVGFVGEAQGFYQDWTVEKNLEFLGRFYGGWDHGFASGLARRFDLRLDKKAKTLSKGNRAKLALVAALGHRPRVLLLDEPTQGLDPVVRTEVLDVLWEFLEDGERSILYSTHVLSDISRLADELVFLRDGQLVGRSAKESLTDTWRRLSFRHGGQIPKDLVGVRSSKSHGAEFQLVSADHEATRRSLQEMGVDGVQVTRMTIEEIAVEILKEGHRVEAA